MMRGIAGFLGIGAACLACCAVPSLGSLLAWFGLASVGSAGLAWIGGLALPAIVLVAAAGFFVWRRGTRTASKSIAESCGCSPIMPVNDVERANSEIAAQAQK